MNEWDIAIQSIERHGRVIAIGLLGGLILALCIIIFQKPVYQAEMVIAPAQRTGMPNLSSFLPQGTNETPVLQYFVDRIDAANASDFTTFETIINGPQLARYLKRERPNLIPSSDTARWLKNHIKIRGVGTTPYRKITIKHDRRDEAIQLLGILFSETDKIIRRDALMKTSRRIAYLKEELKKTLHPDHRDAIIALLKEQERSAMTVSIDNYFAAIPIEQPHASLKPIAPDWRIAFPVCLIAGALLGLMISGLISAIRRA
jgi:hypothetical protein